MNRLVVRLVAAMLLAVVVYAAFVLWTGYAQIAATLDAFRWWTFAAALTLATANYGLRFLKWEYYLRLLDVRGVGKVDSLLVFLSGFVLTVTPGKIGEVFKSAVLAETHGVPVARTAPIVVAERLTDVIGVIVLILVGSAGFAGGLGWAAAGGTAVAVGLTCILWSRPARAIVTLAERGPARLRALAPKLEEAFGNLQRLASPTALVWPTLLSIVGWGAEGGALYLLLLGFDSPVPASLALFFYATATLAGALVPVPGGLGVMEALIQEQLVRLGSTPAPVATAAMILVRFATLWWAVLVGFLALGLLKRRYPSLLARVPAALDTRPPGG